MARHEIKNSRVIITGASSGIGRALALQMARGGSRLVVTARREELLKTLVTEISSFGGTATYVVGDITQPETRSQVIQRAQDAYGGLDILINNAGKGATGLFELNSPERLTRLLDLNVISLVEMTRLAIPLLKESAPGSLLVNISSVVGLRGVSHYSEYCACKFAVRGFSESLRTELYRYGIDVTVVCPGSTDTAFFTDYLENTGEPNWPHHHRVSPEYVAAQIIRAIRKGKREIIPFFLGKVMNWMNKFCPGFLDRAMTWYSK